MRVTTPNALRLVVRRRWLPWIPRGLPRAELVLMVLALPFVVLARTVFGLKWPIEVRRPALGWLVHEESVAGWGASDRRIRELAADIESGRRRIVEGEGGRFELSGLG